MIPNTHSTPKSRGRRRRKKKVVAGATTTITTYRTKCVNIQCSVYHRFTEWIMPLPPHCSHFTRFLWCSNVSDTRWGASLRCYNDNYICTDGKRCMNPIKMRLHRWMRPRVWIAYSSRSFFCLLVNLWVWFALFPCSHKIFFGNSPFEFIRLFALEGRHEYFSVDFFLSYSIVFFCLVWFGSVFDGVVHRQHHLDNDDHRAYYQTRRPIQVKQAKNAKRDKNYNPVLIVLIAETNAHKTLLTCIQGGSSSFSCSFVFNLFFIFIVPFRFVLSVWVSFFLCFLFGFYCSLTKSWATYNV